MSERDDLAQLMFVADNSGQPEAEALADWAAFTVNGKDTYTHRLADAILAAGYRKTRTVTTAEELDGLAAGTIIRDPLPCIKWGSGEWGTFSGDSVGSNRIDLPATVLHEPTA